MKPAKSVASLCNSQGIRGAAILLVLSLGVIGIIYRSGHAAILSAER